MSEVIRFESFDGLVGGNYKIMVGDNIAGYILLVGDTVIIFNKDGHYVYIGYNITYNNIFKHLGIE